MKGTFMANPLPLKDLKFIEFGITYLMLAPSRLQVDILGKKLDVPAAQIDANRIKTALTSAGFHHSDQIYTQFQTYFKYLTRDSNRATLKVVSNFLLGSGEYSDDPPHPDDPSGQSLASAMEGLAGRVPASKGGKGGTRVGRRTVRGRVRPPARRRK
jgi:hypothetical protein